MKESASSAVASSLRLDGFGAERRRYSKGGRRRSSAELVLPRGIGENERMSSVASIVIHASQFPGRVRHDLIESLRTRQVNHKFHYDSVKQTQKWLALHQAYSPSRNDDGCAAAYERAFQAAAAGVAPARVHVIGLGCGGGQKDTRLLELLRDRGKEMPSTLRVM